MKKRQEISSEKKKSVSLNLECWMWELVEGIETNRSKFFRDLLLEKIKVELINEKLMTETDTVSELLGEVYLNIVQYKRKLLTANTDRKPIRRIGIKNAPEDLRKKAISIHMENWLWDIAAKIAPNRSVLFKDLLLQKMKKDLLIAGIVKENVIIGQEHAEQFVNLAVARKINKKVS
jgi:predicted DNA-binding ribbon-helix-helix protein